ncbi:hypothetical protein CRYUN_Cryun07bG0151500 [Craigia yunnanensis]
MIGTPTRSLDKFPNCPLQAAQTTVYIINVPNNIYGPLGLPTELKFAKAALTFTPISPASYLPLSQRKLTSFNPIQCLGTPKEAIQISSNGHATTFPEKCLLTCPVTSSPPPRPRRIILLRHGQCEGNVDESVYTRVADPKIVLTEKGKTEAEECGWRIREMIEKDGATDWKVYFYVSPYKRTLETLQHLGRAFECSRIAGMREEPRIRQQDFGFRETLRADIDIGRFQPPGERSPNVNLIIVSHDLALRVFLMRWYKWTVEQFERLNNMDNGNIIVMEKGYGGRYSLLMHHTEEELREFGLTGEMLIDQECFLVSDSLGKTLQDQEN